MHTHRVVSFDRLAKVLLGMLVMALLWRSLHGHHVSELDILLRSYQHLEQLTEWSAGTGQQRYYWQYW